MTLLKTSFVLAGIALALSLGSTSGNAAPNAGASTIAKAPLMQLAGCGSGAAKCGGGGGGGGTVTPPPPPPPPPPPSTGGGGGGGISGGPRSY